MDAACAVSALGDRFLFVWGSSAMMHTPHTHAHTGLPAVAASRLHDDFRFAHLYGLGPLSHLLAAGNGATENVLFVLSFLSKFTSSLPLPASSIFYSLLEHPHAPTLGDAIRCAR